MRTIVLLHCLFAMLYFASSDPPPEPINCTQQNTNCTVTNAYGSFPDRSICKAGDAVYPTTEKELIEAVANATASQRKMKVVTRYGHSIPKLACPGGDDGLVISTKNLNKVVSIDNATNTITVESGVILRDLIDAAAKAGLALPYTPYWWGLTIGGLLSTGAHGSSLWGKGSAVHEYVVGLRLVTPASDVEGYARVWELDEGHAYMNSARVSLGVLGVISQVTLSLQPLFKRSITLVKMDDDNLAEMAAKFGEQHEFADITWYPGQSKAVYRKDDRVPASTAGSGVNNFIGFRSIPTIASKLQRQSEETFEVTGSTTGKCVNSLLITTTSFSQAYGMTNNGLIFTGYPIVGYVNNLEASGECISSPKDLLLTSCPWDPRIEGLFFQQTGVSISLSKVKDFILDVQKLRDLNPEALCGADLYDGILMRYVKGSTSYLGKEDDSIDFDITYYRSHDPMIPRLNEDIFEEIEQMALFKYGGLPHWGKNRNLAFDGVIEKYKDGDEFLKVKNILDPDGLFSSEWTDQVFGLKGRTSTKKEGCGLEGLCICSEDIHCAPNYGYYCRPGKVYEDARVCALLTEIDGIRIY